MKKALVSLLVLSTIIMFSVSLVSKMTNASSSESIIFSCGGGDDDMPCPLDSYSG